MKHVAIIGNGISGITAARHIRKRSDYRITVISAETEHFFSRTALMYIYMGHMKYEHTKPYEDWFWKKNNIDLIRGYVQKIDTDNKSLSLQGGEQITYDDLILATGSQSNKFGWPGQDLQGVQGLYSYQDLELLEQNTQNIEKAVIVGGGLIGVELAEMLHSRHIPVTFLVRESNFWNNILPNQEAGLVSRHLRENGIDLRLQTELKEILPDTNGRAKAVITNKGEEIPCQLVGLTAGVHPNLDVVKGSKVETERGIVVNEYLETNIPNVYAIGDCAQRNVPLPNRRPVEQVWYTGRMMGEVVARTICGERTVYQPGHWFNSAKFFDIEYQTYGHVWSALKENEAEFHWEDAEGIRCMHFIYDKHTLIFLGVNSFGIRLRHEVMDRWLTEQRKIEYVLENLREANFDPEFFRRFEHDIIAKYNQKHPGAALKSKAKRGLLASLFS